MVPYCLNLYASLLDVPLVSGPLPPTNYEDPAHTSSPITPSITTCMRIASKS